MANQNSLNAPVVFASNKGGTGQSTFAAGDTLYYASGTALSKLSIGSANSLNYSTGSAPAWTSAPTASGQVATYNGTNIVWATPTASGQPGQSVLYFLRMSWPAGSFSNPISCPGATATNIMYATFTGDSAASNSATNPVLQLLNGTTSTPSSNAVLMFCPSIGSIFMSGGGGAANANVGVATDQVAYSKTQWDAFGDVMFQYLSTGANDYYVASMQIPILVSTLRNASTSQLRIVYYNNIGSGTVELRSYGRYMPVYYFPYGLA